MRKDLSLNQECDLLRRARSAPAKQMSAAKLREYVISGRAIHHWGDRLQHSMETKAGDFLFVAPGVPHYPENPYDEPVVAVVARNDPDEQEHVIPFTDG